MRRDGFEDPDVAAAMNFENVFGEIPPAQARHNADRWHRRMESRARREPLEPHLEDNFRELAKVVELPAECVPVLRVMIFLQAESVLGDALNVLSCWAPHKLAPLVARATGIDEQKVLEWIGRRGLFENSGLFRTERRPGRSLPRFFADEIPRQLVDELTPPSRIFGHIAIPRSGSDLTYRDYEHLGESLADLRRYLRTAFRERKKGVNIALYGPPGTGKTELSRVLARDLRAQLFEVATGDADGDPVPVEARFQRIRFAARVLSGRNFLLVDEAEDIFQPDSFFLPSTGPIVGQKAWLHELLATNPIPVLWISNTTDGIDPAAARRFDMALPLPIPPEHCRRKILRKACGGRVSRSFLAEMAQYPQVAPAVVTRCSQVAAQAAPAGEPRAAYEDRVVRLINQILEVQQRSPIPTRDEQADASSALPAVYDPAIVHCQADLPGLAARISRQQEARLCLYGPPGTGKTSYLQWIAEEAGLPMHLHKASDLLDRYLGQTEQKIARAFAKAKEEGAVLVLDEVDSFLRNRAHAERRWEVSQVNELLQQMEDFHGIFAAATNLWDDLDEAALRRFDAKLFFDYLRPAQAEKLLWKYCVHHEIDTPSREDLARVAGCRVLTPGDYATVVRNARLFPLEGPADFVERLLAETRLKKAADARAPLGFQPV